MMCEICGEDILQKNKEVVDNWSKEKQKLYFWYWSGFTNHGKTGLSPYNGDLMIKFEKHYKEDENENI